MRHRNLSPNTQELYAAAGRSPRDLRRAAVGSHLGACSTGAGAVDGLSPTCRALQQFMEYLCEEDEELRNPMEHLEPPIVPEKTVPVLGDEDLAELLGACAGKGFAALRGSAVMRLLLATGGAVGSSPASRWPTSTSTPTRCASARAVGSARSC